MVTDEFDRDAFPIADNVLLAPEIVLFVKVSVVALPTSVSVAAGSVIVLVPAMAGAEMVTVPDVDPSRSILVLGLKLLSAIYYFSLLYLFIITLLFVVSQ
jgi:hypothetical protein